jgi:hypothetical protein
MPHWLLVPLPMLGLMLGIMPGVMLEHPMPPLLVPLGLVFQSNGKKN